MTTALLSQACCDISIHPDHYARSGSDILATINFKYSTWTPEHKQATTEAAETAFGPEKSSVSWCATGVVAALAVEHAACQLRYARTNLSAS